MLLRGGNVSKTLKHRKQKPFLGDGNVTKGGISTGRGFSAKACSCVVLSDHRKKNIAHINVSKTRSRPWNDQKQKFSFAGGRATKKNKLENGNGNSIKTVVMFCRRKEDEKLEKAINQACFLVPERSIKVELLSE